MKAPTKKKISEVATHLAWNFIQVLDPKIITELQSQIEELTTGNDEASDFVQNDPEGQILYTLLGNGLTWIAEKKDKEDWSPVEIFAVAWMLRDLVVETPAQVTE